VERFSGFCVLPRAIAAIAALAASIAVASFPLSAQQMQQNYQQFQVDRGATLYSSNCVECHTDGTGVPGVNLRTGQFPRGSSDDDLMSAIKNGIPGTMMPPHDFNGADLAAMVAYVRSMSQQTELVTLGDAEKGKALFNNEGGCLNCHRVGNSGARTALNLSDTGTLHPPSYLERALLDPDATLAATPESRLVRAVTNQGKTISGRRLNEDTYTIQIMDDHGDLLSLDKADLRSLTVLKSSPMPSAKGKFSDEQVSDLVAYLASLKSISAAAPTQFGSPPGIGGGFGAPGRGGAGRGAAPAASSAPSAITPPATRSSGGRP
jgi:cytochrome c oxidase cbb3-type subunit III